MKILFVAEACPKLSENFGSCPSEYPIGHRTISEFRSFGFRLASLVQIPAEPGWVAARVQIPAEPGRVTVRFQIQ